MTLLLVRAISAVRAQVSAQRQAEHQALHDPLTGLPNRRSITRRDRAAAGPAGRAGGPPRLGLPARPGRLQVGQRLVGPRHRRSGGDRGRRAAARRDAGVTFRSPGWAATSSCSRTRGDKAGALRLADEIRGCFVRPYRGPRHRGADHRVDRDRARGRRRRQRGADRRGADAGRRHRDVPGQGRGTRPLDDLRHLDARRGAASGSSSRWRCARPSPTSSCTWPISRSCGCPPACRWAPRPWCGGCIRTAGRSRRACSSRSPRRPG